ncbi:MAG TPA: DUF4440 domain-containing protein [Thermoleophilaceae bacterium]|nr:DUF4440 domain-containing protein [Thermoleophilaceae bacterium]
MPLLVHRRSRSGRLPSPRDGEGRDACRGRLARAAPARSGRPRRHRGGGAAPSRDFREIGAFGETWDRKTITGALAATPGDRVAVSGLTARFVRDDVVLVTYAARRGTRASLRSSPWVRGGDGWQVLFHRGTPVDRDV